jgi:hypothetical protein
MSLTKVALAVIFALSLSAAVAQTHAHGDGPPAVNRVARSAAAFDKATVEGSVSLLRLPIPTPTSCPQVNVTCPTDPVKPGTPLTFTANISGGDPDVTPTFKWTVSAGTITSGQDTSLITVDAAALSVTAAVEVGGYEPACPMSSSCTVTTDYPPVPRKVDEYGDIAVGDEKARLDNFAVELQNDPTAQGYLICYGGRRGARGAALRRCDRAKNFLVISRGIDAWRITALDGGDRNGLTVEAWIVPSGATPPKPTPTVSPRAKKKR